MRFPRRQFLQIAAGVAGLPAMPRIASAQTAYPTRPITMIVPLAGGITDVVARVVGERMRVSLDHRGDPACRTAAVTPGVTQRALNVY